MNFTFTRLRRAAVARCALANLTFVPLALAITLAVFLRAQVRSYSSEVDFLALRTVCSRSIRRLPRSLGLLAAAVNFDPAPGAMVQDSQGRVYILESNQSRVKRFGPTGNFIDLFANGGFGGGLGLTMGMAIDAAGNIYISSGGANTFSINDDAIVRFSSCGTPLGTFGQATNAASGYIAGGPLAFDSQGNLYTGYAGQIVRYSPSGTALECLLIRRRSWPGLQFARRPVCERQRCSALQLRPVRRWELSPTIREVSDWHLTVRATCSLPTLRQIR